MPGVSDSPILPPPLIDPPQQLADPPDLLDPLPPFERNSHAMVATLTAISNELQRVEEARQELILNYFPSTAAALLHFFELTLGLPIDSPLITLQQRQAAVLAFMRHLKAQGSGLEWEASLSALIGSTWTYHEHDPDDPDSPLAYHVLIRLPFTAGAPVPSGLILADGGAASGSNTAGTYYYAVTATTVYGETTISAASSITIAAGHAVGLSWTGSGTPTTGYNIYRGPSPGALGLIGSSTAATFTDGGVATIGAGPPMTDGSGSIQAGTALKLARAITPAHIVVDAGYNAGFLIGISKIGIDAL